MSGRTAVAALAFFLGTGLYPPAAAARVVGDCKFDDQKLEFAGTPGEQAACLLRKIQTGGRPTAQPIPPTLTALLSGPGPSADQAAAAIASLAPADGTAWRATLDKPVARTAGGRPALYFVIHDTSSPYLENAPFPGDLDTDPSINGIARYAGANAVAHVFVNRKGEMVLGHDFAVPWRATKLETKVIGSISRGRFLHIELVQPRRRDPAGPAGNDRFAPETGFSDLQYKRLAALYVIASRRAGQWLTPAFHAAIDAGLSDGHDDPQHFELIKWVADVAELAGSHGEGAPSAPPASPVGAAAQLRGQPLDETYRAKFSQCDRTNAFGSVQFPITRNGRTIWYGCSSDPNRLTRFERFPADGRRPEAILFEAKLAHDLDGSPAACSTPGKTDQCETSLMLRPTPVLPCPAPTRGKTYCLPIDASRIPYIVIPMAGPAGIDGHEFRTKTGLAIGDVGIVIYGGKTIAVLIADGGPAYKIGEGSTALLSALSNDGRPRSIASGVTFIGFPRTTIGREANADTLAETVRSVASDLYARLTAGR